MIEEVICLLRELVFGVPDWSATPLRVKVSCSWVAPSFVEGYREANISFSSFLKYVYAYNAKHSLYFARNGENAHTCSGYLHMWYMNAISSDIVDLGIFPFLVQPHPSHELTYTKIISFQNPGHENSNPKSDATRRYGQPAYAGMQSPRDMSVSIWSPKRPIDPTLRTPRWKYRTKINMLNANAQIEVLIRQIHIA